MKSKSKKQVPKVRLPKFSPGGSSSYNEGLPSTLQTGTNTQTGNSTTDYMNDKRTGKSKMDTANQYAGYATSIASGIGQLSNNSSLHGRAKEQADAAAINGTVDAVAGSVLPWYAAAKTASGVGRGLINKDQNTGLATTATGAATDALFTPVHEQAIDDATKGNWGDATLDVLLGGFYKPIKDYANFDKDKAKADGELKVRNDQMLAEQKAQQKQQDDYNKMYNYYQQQQGLPQAKYGGRMMYAMGGMNKYPGGGMGEGNGQVENDENSVAPNGQFTQFNEPPHSQQNPNQPNASLAQGEKIFSAKLKPIGSKKTFADLNKPNNTNREDKLATKDNLDPKSRISLALTKMAKMKNSNMLFAMQEQLKKDKVQAYAQKMGVQLPSMDNEQMESQGMSEQSEGEVATARYGGMYAKGGIHINPANKGKFTASAQHAGMGTQEFARHVLANKEDYSSTQVKRANFAHNAAGWKHEMGGVQLPYYNTDNDGNPTYAMGGNYPAMSNPYHKFKGRIPAYGGGGKSYIDPSETDMQEQADRNAYYDSLSKVNNTSNINQNGLNLTPTTWNWNTPTTTPTANQAVTQRVIPTNETGVMNLNQSSKGNYNPELDKINWGDVAGNVGNFALQNAGNIYDLTRKNAPLTSYERAKASYLDSSAAMRAADQEAQRARAEMKNQAAGSAGNLMSNTVALATGNTINKAKIAQDYANANAGIGNQNAQFNAEIAYREREARDKDAATKQNVNSQAIHSIASSFGKASKSGKEDKMDQKELALFQWRYKNEPGFKEHIDSFSNKKSKTATT